MTVDENEEHKPGPALPPPDTESGLEDNVVRFPRRPRKPDPGPPVPPAAA